MSDEELTGDLSSFVDTSTKIGLLLDYDGTLSPIAKHPDLAVLPPKTKEILERLAANPDIFIAVISGRNVNDVKSKVGIDGITYAGNHGLEIHHPDGQRYVHPLPAPKLKIGDLKKALEDEVCQDGAWIEDKGPILTYHYRNVEDDKRPPLVERAKEIIGGSGYKVGLAHCALECKPKVDWHKGKASAYILENAFGQDWKDEIKVLYAGDDVTDEDAMIALKGNSLTFRIVADEAMETAADKKIASIDTVVKILQWVQDHVTKT